MAELNLKPVIVGSRSKIVLLSPDLLALWIVHGSPAFLITANLLPQDARITCASWDTDLKCIQLVVESAEFEPRADGAGFEVLTCPRLTMLRSRDPMFSFN